MTHREAIREAHALASHCIRDALDQGFPTGSVYQQMYHWTDDDCARIAVELALLEERHQAKSVHPRQQ